MDTTQRTEQQRSADRRRRELLEAADRVVLRDGPQASMNAIAAEAGITKPILYRHFGDKNGLYAALAARLTVCSSELMRSDPTRYTEFDSLGLLSRLRPIMSMFSCVTIRSIGTVG